MNKQEMARQRAFQKAEEQRQMAQWQDVLKQQMYIAGAGGGGGGGINPGEVFWNDPKPQAGTIIPRDKGQFIFQRIKEEATKYAIEQFGPTPWYDEQTGQQIDIRMDVMFNGKRRGDSEALREAQDTIKEITEILERVQKEPLIMMGIERISKDKKHAFIKMGDKEMRIEVVKDLEVGDEVLIHPKSMQIVERLGRPPLEVSRFAPDQVPDIDWDDIGGLEQAKADMIEAIELPHTHKELFTHYGKKPIKGILLSGPPGCGKTMLGKAAAHALFKLHGGESARTGFLYVKGPEILDQYVGQSERCIRDIFFDAKRHKEQHGYPAIVFLDEADAILAARGTRNVGIGNTIVPAFLTEMDGMEDSGAVVIIATNRPDVLDPAIVRDGRCDRKVSVTRPDPVNAWTIAQKKLAKTPLTGGTEELATAMVEAIYAKDRFINPGVRMAKIVNGAMLVNCVEIAIGIALKRDIAEKTMTGVTKEDILAAVDRLQKQSAVIRHDLDVEQ
jgi:ATP-dependent 26S proteasome regulatory subunit